MKAKPSFFFVFGIMALIFVWSLLAYLTQTISMPLLFNSDALYLPAVFHDIGSLGGKYSDWYLTPAPYFFPDWLMYACGYGTTKLFGVSEIFWGVGLSLVLQTLLTGALIFALLAHILDKSAVYAVSMLVFVAFVYLAAKDAVPFNLIWVTGHHWGTLLVVFFSVSLVLHVVQQDSGRYTIQACVLFFLCFAACMSDRIFLLWFSFPAAAALLLLVSTSLISKKKILVIVSCILVPSAIGDYSVRHFLLPFDTHYTVTYSADFLSGHFYELGKILDLQQPWIYVLIFGIGAPGFFVWMRTRRIGMRHSKVLFLCLYGFFLYVFVFSGVFFSSMPFAIRYLIPLWLYPIITALCLVYSAAAFYMRQGSINTILWMGCAILIGLLFHMIDVKKIQTDYYPDEAQCLDAAITGLPNPRGISGYWDAKKMMLVSRTKGVTIASVFNDMTPYRWIVSDRWFGNYNFALLSKSGPPSLRLDEQQVRKKFGMPTRRQECGAFVVVCYEHGMRDARENSGVQGGFFCTPMTQILREFGFKVKIEPQVAQITIKRGQVATIPVKVTNLSDSRWSSAGKDGDCGPLAIVLAYHVLDNDGKVIVFDGDRTALPGDVHPNQSVMLNASISAPAKPGNYTYLFDMVQESVSWFGGKGSAVSRIKVTVR
jgi:hypothetical protein